MAFITANNANFYYELHGSGHPLVLISGYSGNGQSWMPIVGELSKYFQVLIFDNRGIGQTTDNNEDLTIELMADDVIAICDKLQLNKPHVIGRSMGGNITQSIAARYPDKISKIGVLVSAAKWRTATITSLDIQLKLQEQNVDPELINDNSYSWLLGEAFLSNPELMSSIKLAQSQQTLPPTLKNLRRQFNAIRRFNGVEQLDKILAPTFIGYGTEDLLALPQDSRFLAERINNSKLVEFECGHLVVIEQTQKLIKHLIDFFKN